MNGLRDYGVAGQIGLEPSPDEYVTALVAVFREARRVLRSDGALWLNIGDSYAGGGHGGGGSYQKERNWRLSEVLGTGGQQGGSRNRGGLGRVTTCKPKDLIGIPWMLAFALRADGWWLRQDIIWSKPNPMPESVTDRCTKAHEYLFLLSKSERYYYDAEAIKERAVADDLGSMDGGPQRLADGSNANDGRNFRIGAKGNAKTFRGGVYTQGRAFKNHGEMERDSHGNAPNPSLSRNKRSVWTVATSPFPEAHFATFPPALIEPCILAGTSEYGVCGKCGGPWERATGRPCGACGEMIPTQGKSCPSCGHVHDWKAGRDVSAEFATTDWSTPGKGTPRKLTAAGKQAQVGGSKTVTAGWRPTCSCGPDAGMRAAVVLDPFGGAGTTALVADRLKRDAILVELNPAYAEMAWRRIEADAGLFANIAAD